MRSCLVATALARRTLAEAEVSEVFYTALLEHIGCSGFAHEAAARYGDELVANAAAARTNIADPRDVMRTFMPAVARRARTPGPDRCDGDHDGQAGRTLFATAACEVGQATARRLGLPTGVQRGLHEVYEPWNGKGGAHGLRGDAIALAGRITQVGSDRRPVRPRSGERIEPSPPCASSPAASLDPERRQRLAAALEVLLRAAHVDDLHAAVIDAEPSPGPACRPRAWSRSPPRSRTSPT